MIPVSREEVEIREEVNGAILINTKEKRHIFISPLDAFMYTLLDGTRTVDDIVRIFQSAKNAPEEKKIREDICKLIQKWSIFVEIIEKPLEKKRISIDPSNFLKMPDLHAKPFRASTPLSLELYVTRRCNLNCAYCYADATQGLHIKSSQREEMDSGMLNCIIDQIIDLQIGSITLAGGEPTLRSDLPKIIQRFTDHGIDVHLPTNACLIDDNLARALKDAGLTRIQAKLDAAHPEVQDRLSRVKGSYDKLIKGIETLKNHSFVVAVVMVVTALNIRELPDVAKICADLNVDELAIRMYTPGICALHGRGGADLNPSLEDVQWMVETTKELQETYKGALEIKPPYFSWFYKYEENKVPSCEGLTLSCVILENGLVIPCEMLADFSNEFIIGNIKEKPLLDIWNSEKAQKWVLREDVNIGGPCLSCDEFKRCKGGCPWKSIVAYGEWLGDPSCVKTPQPTKISLAEVPPRNE